MKNPSAETTAHSESFQSLATQPSVAKRAAKIAFIVGIVLATINHGDKVMAGALTTSIVVKILLTFLVPYSVSTYSSVLAIREKSQFLLPNDHPLPCETMK